MPGERDKFEIYLDQNGGWRWRRKAPNGKLVGASCEPFSSKKDCEANMRRGVRARDKWVFYQAEAGAWRWRRVSANGKTVAASSESFGSKADAQANAERQGFAAKVP